MTSFDFCRVVPRLSALFIALVASACTGDADRAGLTTLGERVVTVGAIRLEENAAVLNVAPRVTLDPRGGFLVADEREAQVRRYAGDGKLLFHFGRRGSGPGEFEYLHSAHRLPDGSILAFDTRARAMRFDSAGTRVQRTFATDFGPLFHAQVLNDSLVLLGGMREGEPSGSRLHLWNYETGQVIRSFFTPPVPDENYEAVSMVAGFTSAGIRGDTVAVLFAVSDTVYLYTLDGTRRGQIPIPYEGFRPVTRSLPAGQPTMEQMHEWLGSFSLGTDVFWLRDGSFVVQYQDRVALEQKWHLLRMDRSGKPMWEVNDTPRLLTVDVEAGRVYLIDPTAEAPNAWMVGEWAS